MFSVEQIMACHAKVRSGADFPAYIAELKTLGVRYYQTFVSDGHTVFFGENDYTVVSEGKYPQMNIAYYCDAKQFESTLKTHQAGKSDYMTFCKECAITGIEKWSVSTEAMTCTYYDTSGNTVLIEAIPQ